MTSARERNRRYRVRKQAQELIEDEFDGDESVTPEDFLEGMASRFCRQHRVAGVRFLPEVLNRFHDDLIELEGEGNLYRVEDLLDIWKRAQQGPN
jgi:hypothetical protein